MEKKSQLKTFYILYNKSEIRGEPYYRIEKIQARNKMDARNKGRKLYPRINDVYGIERMTKLKTYDVVRIKKTTGCYNALSVMKAISDVEL